MRKRQLDIQQFKLTSDTHLGILIGELNNDLNPSHNAHDAHRDDHFSLMFAFTGEFHFKIDFVDLYLKAPFVLCIDPNQIHQTVSIKDQSGWVMAIDGFKLEVEIKNLLLTKLSKPLVFGVSNIVLTDIQIIMKLAFDIQKRAVTAETDKSITYLISSLFCLLSKPTFNIIDPNSKKTRGHIIEYSFRELLRKQFKSWKKPANYALNLSITTAHLNDVLKETTGFSTSSNIQEYNILEAKRLLYITDLEVREIAFQLGYDDVVYFTKLFKKLTGTTCLTFRKQFRD